MHTLEVQLADVDRGVYEDLTMRAAQHPSETLPFLATRLLAYCLEYSEGIGFSAGGVSSTDEPAVSITDLTGSIMRWIEVGAPTWQRLHTGRKQSESLVVYSHRDASVLLASWAGKAIYRADDIRLITFDEGFCEALAARLARRTRLSLSRTEGQIYLEVDGEMLTSAVHEHSIVDLA